MLTPEQLAERKTRIGGSDAGKIVNGLWHELWLEKTGRAEPEDLTWVLPVQIGTVTEPLNIAFFEHATGHQVFGRGEVYIHPDYPFVGCTLDGMTLIDRKPAIVQCKHVSAFAKIEEVEQRYYAQCSHEMLCTGASIAYLSVFVGTFKHDIIEIHRDRDYTNRLLEMEREFWSFIERDEPPPNGAELAAPARIDAMLEYDMDGHNEFASHAGAWLETHKHARSFEIATKAIKKLVPADARRCFGYGISVERNKAGALTIRSE